MRYAVTLAILLLTGCATATPPGSYRVWQQLQVTQLAGTYPDDWTIYGDSHAAALHALEQWTEQQGIVLAPAHLGRKNLLGHTSLSKLAGWIVLVDQDQPVNTRLYTLLHELAHVYSPATLWPHPEADEVFAEMVADQVCEGIGLHVHPQTAAYLAARVPIAEQGAIVGRVERSIDQTVEKLAAVVRTAGGTRAAGNARASVPARSDARSRAAGQQTYR
jgi:hypothetical protein